MEEYDANIKNVLRRDYASVKRREKCGNKKLSARRRKEREGRYASSVAIFAALAKRIFLQRRV
jgi:ribosomal protein S6